MWILSSYNLLDTELFGQTLGNMRDNLEQKIETVVTLATISGL
jgi:hypothetical protein